MITINSQYGSSSYLSDNFAITVITMITKISFSKLIRIFFNMFMKSLLPFSRKPHLYSTL